MKLVLDAMGGDHAPGEVVAGAIDYVRATRHTVILVGDEAQIRAQLAAAGAPVLGDAEYGSARRLPQDAF